MKRNYSAFAVGHAGLGTLLLAPSFGEYAEYPNVEFVKALKVKNALSTVFGQMQ